MKNIIKYIKKELFIFFILTLILSIIMVSESYLLKYIVDTSKFKDIREYLFVGIVVIVFLLLQTFIYYTQQFLTSYLSKKSVRIYRNIIFNKLEDSPLSLLFGEKHNKILSSIINQIDQLEMNYFYTIFWGIYLICQFIIAVLVAFNLDIIMSLFILLLTLPNLIVTLLFKNKLEKNQEQLVAQRDKFVFKINNLIEGLIDWLVSNKREGIKRRFSNINNSFFEKDIKVEKLKCKITTLNQFFSNVLYFGSWYIGGILIIKGELTIGSLIAFSQLFGSISFPVYSSSALLSNYINGKKIYDSLENEFSVSNYGQEILSINKIEFLDFMSPKFKINDKFNYIFVKGKKYFLKGRSGIGKTTIIKSILKENKDFFGNIIINNLDINDVSQNSIFNNISYLPQKTNIFEGTIRDNITMFNDDYKDSEIFEILKFVELSEWANEKYLNKEVSMNKIQLSGGEIKKIGLARVLLQNKPILILDEFSSGLDGNSLQNIEVKLLNLDKTIIYISHIKNNQLNYFDYILDLDNY